MSWKPYLSYVFPPFCLISRILQKIQEEKATVTAVVPHWPMQIWWPKIIGLLIRHPIILPNTKTIQSTSQQPRPHPSLVSSIPSTFLPLAWRYLQDQGISTALPTSSSVRGGTGSLNNTNFTSVNGNHTVVNGKLIYFEPLLLTE